MREFAEREVVLPTGQYAGRRFRVDRNPFAGAWFDAVDSGLWRRLFATGPQGSGKTLNAFVIPIMYHLFEVKETVLCGLPTLDMVADKWNLDLLPVIQASRYRDLLPKSGAGSKGGDAVMIQFKHGPVLRFMSGGGGDKARAAFHCRVLVATEIDGLDESGGTSQEADKLSQLEGRTRSYGDRSVIYGECTLTDEEGRTWREYTGGTESRLALRCPHCREFVTPEREQLVGWQGASDVLAAGEGARLACPACGVLWDETDRSAANHDYRLAHRGQTVRPDGTVEGEAPRTDTLGFRWTAANNLLVNMATVGKEEWRSKRDPDERNAEKKMRQWYWTLPVEPEAVDLTQLDHNSVMKRVSPGEPRGRVPSDADVVTVGVDIGKRLCHWAAPAWRQDGSPHVIDYGRFEVASDEIAMERALLAALRDFRDQVVNKGWEGRGGERIVPELVLIDCGWVGEESEDLDEVVYAFCKESNALVDDERYLPAKGWAAGRYRHPTQKDVRVREVGDQYYVARIQEKKARLVQVNSDHWKGRVHARLRTPIGEPGAMTLFAPAAKPNGDPDYFEHLAYGKHLTAEKQEETFKAGRGKTVGWKVLSRSNHFLDATMLSFVAGHKCGGRLIGAKKALRKILPADVAARAEATAEGRTAPAGEGATARAKREGGWFSNRKRR